MQNSKCKMQNLGTKDGSAAFLQNQSFFEGQRLFGFLTAKIYQKIGFCEAKGFINFAFCILNFAFAVYRPQTDKLQFEHLTIACEIFSV